MPGVYQGTCPQCGRKNWATDWALAYYTDDDRVEFLAHPNESDEITRFGTTLEAAKSTGRLVWSDTIVCNACGVIGSRNKLHRPGPSAPAKWFMSRHRRQIQQDAIKRRELHLLPSHRCSRCGSDDLAGLSDYIQGDRKIACAVRRTWADLGNLRPLMIPPITRDQVRKFELLGSRCAESLMRPVGAIENNSQGYAYFTHGPVHATLSTNPYAVWATSACGMNNADSETIEATIQFFRSHAVPAKVRNVPEGFTKEKADRLSSYNLRHTGFHTVMWSPLPTKVEPDPGEIRIEHVTTPAEYDVALEVQLEGWGVPYTPNSPLVKLRRIWRTLSDHRMYLAYYNGEPAAHAMLYTEGRVGYLENASTIKRFRNKGLHGALIRRRINDAMAMGCDTIVGGADFESPSRTNQMRCGLQIAYLAAIWSEGVPGIPSSRE